MKPRINLVAAQSSPLAQAWMEFSKATHQAGLEESLIKLVEIRASQINGCAFCLHMHTAEARAAGETEERLYLIDAWRESPLYSDRERAALAWTESVTLVSETRVPDDVYNELKAHFNEQEQIALTMLVVAINGWNRMNVAFKTVHPIKQHKAA
jgi:AhpD family alkylhydroperoxidase